MAHLILFTTSLFDLSKERPNPINPIFGESVLKWLRESVFGPPFESTEPDAEDWGWYIEVTAFESTYLIGACAEHEEDSNPQTGGIEWQIQVEKIRTFKEKLLGRNKMQTDDPLVEKMVGALKREPAFSDVEVERSA